MNTTPPSPLLLQLKGFADIFAICHTAGFKATLVEEWRWGAAILENPADNYVLTVWSYGTPALRFTSPTQHGPWRWERETTTEAGLRIVSHLLKEKENQNDTTQRH